MKRDSAIIQVIGAVLTICQIASAPALAWDPIAHYAIAKAAALAKGWDEDAAERIARCANLPDYVPSGTLSYSPLGRLLSVHFCWSHAVQDRGHFASDRTVGRGLLHIHGALKPIYPDDGRYPGEIMRVFFTHKLDLREASAETLDSLRYAINGFRAHNAADRVAHFEFFQGAQREMVLANGARAVLTNEEMGLAWTADHNLKEAWADYEVLFEKGFIPGAARFTGRGQINLAGLKPGFARNFWLAAGEQRERRAIAALMHLAQLAHRKNRWENYDYNDGQKHAIDRFINVQSIDDIMAAIDENREDAEARTINNWLSHIFGVYVADYIGQLVPDVDWTDPVSGTHYHIVLSTPANNQAEYYTLKRYEEYSLARFSLLRRDAWRIWDREEIFSCFDRACEMATQWMFSLAELKARHERAQ